MGVRKIEKLVIAAENRITIHIILRLRPAWLQPMMDMMFATLIQYIMLPANGQAGRFYHRVCISK